MPLSEADARARAEAEVRAYCGWHIAPSQRETLVVDGDDASSIMLPTLMLTDVHALSVDQSDVPLADVEWSASGFVRAQGRTSQRLRSISADVTHGYEAMPLDVEAVIERLAERAVDTAGMGQLVQVGQVRVATASDGLPATGILSELERWVLDRYRLPPRP